VSHATVHQYVKSL